jgi:hypothetical protein
MLPLKHETWWGDLIALGLAFLAGYLFHGVRIARENYYALQAAEDTVLLNKMRHDSEGRRIPPDPPTPKDAQVILWEGDAPPPPRPKKENARADRC